MTDHERKEQTMLKYATQSDAVDALMAAEDRAEQAEADVKRYREALAEIYRVAKDWRWDMPGAVESQALGFALGRCQGIAEETLTA